MMSVTRQVKESARCGTWAEASQWLHVRLEGLHDDKRIHVMRSGMEPLDPFSTTWLVWIEFEQTFSVEFYPPKP